ncbi:hypothetical protein [Neomicrococcus lactis]|uniref:hypothetical protein n=1 Tax=Neomicrococcus lactis TaxID=732241 RepID=UPI00230141F4|nr:hypothetical protein [Neomicrococcus lactis]
MTAPSPEDAPQTEAASSYRVRVVAPPDYFPAAPAKSATVAADYYFVQSLVRAQLRLSLMVAVGFIVLLVGIALIVAFWPEIRELRLFHIPLAWVVLGVGVYPILMLAAVLFTRGASKNERLYSDLVKDIAKDDPQNPVQR